MLTIKQDVGALEENVAKQLWPILSKNFGLEFVDDWSDDEICIIGK